MNPADPGGLQHEGGRVRHTLSRWRFTSASSQCIFFARLMVITTVEGRLGSSELPEPDPRFWGGPGRLRRGLRTFWSQGPGARLLLISLVVSFFVTAFGSILWFASGPSRSALLGAALLAGGLAGSAAL